MERLFVFADFNWLGKAELVGELCYEKLCGSDSYAFKFDENWLKVHAGIKLSEDINILLDSSESYMIKREEAENIIQEVQAAVSQWESLATQLQIPAREIDMFKERFKLNL